VNRYNLNEPEFAYDETDPAGYRSAGERIGPKVGGQKLGASHYLIPPGQSLCPYHYEYGEEEWLIVLDGVVTVRHPEGEDDLRQGDIVAFPEGPGGAHKVTNNSDADARVLMWSNIAPVGAVVYPDSDKIMINPPDRSDHLLVERKSNVDYWVGER
jgi:uncharacterized cupin superfamily protein